MAIEKNKIILENFEMGGSYPHFGFLNFHRNLNPEYGHVLKVSMSMPLVPTSLQKYVDGRLHPLVINTYEKTEDHKEGSVNVVGSKKGDIYSVDSNGNCIGHIYSVEDKTFDSMKNRTGFGFGNLLNHSKTFTEALNQFETQMKRDVIKNDPRQQFVDRIKKIKGLIGKF